MRIEYNNFFVRLLGVFNLSCLYFQYLQQMDIIINIIENILMKVNINKMHCWWRCTLTDVTKFERCNNRFQHFGSQRYYSFLKAAQRLNSSVSTSRNKKTNVLKHKGIFQPKQFWNQRTSEISNVTCVSLSSVSFVFHCFSRNFLH